jgi:hypothetical protein
MSSSLLGSAAGGGGLASLSVQVDLPEDLVRQLAAQVAEVLEQSRPARDGWLRGAARIAEYLDCPRSRVYALVSAGRILVEHDGSNLIARQSDLDRWIRSGGATRP